MGQRGPAPRPTALKILHGDREDRINRTEPVPSDGEVEPPTWLTEGARERFLRLAPDLHRNAGLAWWDNDMFAVYCDLVDDYAMGTRTRRLRVAPVLRAWAREFGLSPAARSGIRVGETRSKSGAERLLS
jgi:phage terminase small subunit